MNTAAIRLPALANRLGIVAGMAVGGADADVRILACKQAITLRTRFARFLFPQSANAVNIPRA
jgi:hypothetical protein